jgi:hypothetical protein
MTPEIELIEKYNTWFRGVLGDIEQVRAGLPDYITNETVLNEPASIPWGGAMVGYDGWAHMLENSLPHLAAVGADLEISDSEYSQRDNIVLREITLTIKPSTATPEPFVMGIVEKYTIENGRIKQIDEFYADTASFLKRLGISV